MVFIINFKNYLELKYYLGPQLNKVFLITFLLPLINIQKSKAITKKNI